MSTNTTIHAPAATQVSSFAKRSSQALAQGVGGFIQLLLGGTFTGNRWELLDSLCPRELMMQLLGRGKFKSQEESKPILVDGLEVVSSP